MFVFYHVRQPKYKTRLKCTAIADLVLYFFLCYLVSTSTDQPTGYFLFVLRSKIIHCSIKNRLPMHWLGNVFSLSLPPFRLLLVASLFWIAEYFSTIFVRSQGGDFKNTFFRFWNTTLMKQCQSHWDLLLATWQGAYPR